MDFVRFLKAGVPLWLSSSLAWAGFNSIIWDNDLLSLHNMDAHYTNGLVYHRISDPIPLAQAEAQGRCPGLNLLARLFGSLLLPVDEVSELRHSWEVGQIIETPESKIVPPDPDDQPYAGLLYAGCNRHLLTADHAESLGLQFGVVGPWSLAEDTQKAAHHLKGDKASEGWDEQLRNEVVINLRYDRQTILQRFNLGSARFIVHDNRDFALGPLMTSLALGLNVIYAGDTDAAFGLNPNYLGRYPRLSKSRPIGFYTLAGVQVMAVARNLFLDGNTWVKSRSVEREPLVGSAQLLLGYGLPCLALQLGLNVSTRTFATQKNEHPQYGTLTVAWGCSK